jgi:anti-anti-sigma factor
MVPVGVLSAALPNGGAVDQETVLPRAADGAFVISLAGELDLAAVETLQAKATAALDQPGARALIFDMTAVTFIDAAGINALVDIRNHAAVEVTNVPLKILRVLAITGVTKHLGARA